MKDRFGNHLEVGDTVAFISSQGYRELCLGKVLAMTPKQLRIEDGRSWNGSTLRYPFAVIQKPA